ncbi:LYR motif-containing protein 1 isoform X1 [Lagopus muta]|uniref:LYR motif-containing protein 1 isoform X1 n=1 Tax=Lagopus muta TaxID=64668 RepID=UPI0020A11532|nr:LYR motif-containing protein 1 isoform X1 [Lagopus muta]
MRSGGSAGQGRARPGPLWRPQRRRCSGPSWEARGFLVRLGWVGRSPRFLPVYGAPPSPGVGAGGSGCWARPRPAHRCSLTTARRAAFVRERPRSRSSANCCRESAAAPRCCAVREALGAEPRAARCAHRAARPRVGRWKSASVMGFAAPSLGVHEHRAGIGAVE